jgi:hypothetical protein
VKETILACCVKKKARLIGKYMNPGIAQKGRRNLKGVGVSVAGSRGMAACMPVLFCCLFCKLCYTRSFGITITCSETE